jgi:hypothetical protein
MQMNAAIGYTATRAEKKQKWRSKNHTTDHTVKVMWRNFV